MTRQRTTLLFVIAALLAGVVQAQPRCDDVKFRIWRPSGNTYFDFGQTLTLQPGEKAHLYIHHRSNGDNPYGTSASIGHAADYGYRGGYKGQDVFTFNKQSADDQSNGRLEIQAKGPGQFPVGYRITGVRASGLFDRLRPGCREGLVQIQVGRGGNGGNGGGGGGGGGGSRPAPTGISAQRAAQQLSRGIHMALMPWQNQPFDPAEVNAVLRRGRPALVDVATKIMKSSDFQQGSYQRTLDENPDLARAAGGTPRVGIVAGTLLDSLQKQFFGDLRVTQNEHRDLMESLLSCLNRPEGPGCRGVAEGLVNHPNFAQHHREEMAVIEAGG